jgi:hypothetical protein
MAGAETAPAKAFYLIHVFVVRSMSLTISLFGRAAH